MATVNTKVASTEKIELTILYGSQTGTAEELAERVGRESIKYDLNPSLFPLNEIDLIKLSKIKLGCFIVSTTGQGEEPNNMKLFWKSILKRSLPSTYLNHMKFSIFGLGDSSYIKYNFVGKKLYKRLIGLGANPLTTLFLGDDQHDLGPEPAIQQWLSSFWESLGLSNQLQNIIKPKFNIQFLSEEHVKVHKEQIKNNSKIVQLCKLMKNPRVTTEDHFQDVRLISIDISNSNLKYNCGDVALIQPTNSKRTIEQFFKIFPQYVSIRYKPLILLPNLNWASIPKVLQDIYDSKWTLDLIVSNYFDLQSVPKLYFFQLLAYFTTNELEKEKLEELCSKEGQQDLYNYCIRPKRSVLEVLQDFPYATSSVPFNYLFDLIRPIKPRAFSIASSENAHKRELQLLVAVVKYKTVKLKEPRYGLCSNWLANISPGEIIPIWIEHGSFRFPSTEEKTCNIMIGPGTGVAPFRSYISHVTSTSNFGNETKLILFFGCRNSSKDFYFKDEWTYLQDKNQLILFTTFSRENIKENPRSTYVQHKIEENGEYLWSLLNNHKGIVYIAGNAKQMPIDVSNAFLNIFKANGCSNPNDYFKELIKNGRYQTEVWS